MATRLSGPQKAAILLLSLGEEAAAEVIKNLSEDEIKEVSQYMARFQHVTPSDVDRVMNEFYLVAEKGRFLPAPPETKMEYLKKILARAVGEEQATQTVQGLVERKPESPFEELRWHDPQTIASFLAGEHPQVIAVILANLGDPSLAQAVIAALPDDMQRDILTRYARIRVIPDEWLEEIEASLSQDIAASRARPAPAPAGEQRVASVLSASAQPMEDLLIEHLRGKNPELAERISKRMFSFADLIKIDNYGVQLILKRTPGDDLVLALKIADEPLSRHLMRNMSEDAARKIQEAIDGLGPTPVTRIEAAQKRIANTARVLIENGEIYPLERRPATSATE
ncbi:MAG TPA: flagellar motor switch protein FliG [bacterium]|nr:flagellar motor switch protein FliG [bacterium]HKJ92744.1 flagellar motor switch protein FliG [Longimicrobiales bacterium]